MTRYTCYMCNKRISVGVFQYSMDHFKHPLCMLCQAKKRRAEEIKQGTYTPEKLEFLECVHCGKKFEKAKDTPYCDECKKQMRNFKPSNPFSPTAQSKPSSQWDSDHYD